MFFSEDHQVLKVCEASSEKGSWLCTDVLSPTGWTGVTSPGRTASWHGLGCWISARSKAVGFIAHPQINSRFLGVDFLFVELSRWLCLS